MALLVNSDIKRSFFDLSHMVNTTVKMGKVYPILCEPVLPADTFKFSAEMLIRVASGLAAPVMSNPTIRLHWFFVPNRLVWTDWEAWITESLAGGSSVTLPYVTIPADGYNVSSLMHYLGVPHSEGDGIQISALPIRGFAQLWNDWFRPAQKSGTTSLVALKTIDKTDGQDTTTYGVAKTDLPPQAAWEKDYFTSCLLTPQAKATSITVPIGTTAPVEYVAGVSGSNGKGTLRLASDDSIAGNGVVQQSVNDLTVNAIGEVFYDPRGTLQADLSSATGISIKDLRWYSSLQRFFERLIKGTPRYTSFISTFFGVESSDQRLQRAELIGATKTDLIVSEVLSTNGAAGGDLGQLGGHGIGALGSDVFEWSSEEHGYLYCTFTCRPRTQYFEGIPRDFLKHSAEDFGIPEFSLIGEQAVTLAEVTAQAANPTAVFGYQNKYAEYKTIPNKVSGLITTTYDYWTFLRVLGASPTLNEAFVMCTPSVEPLVEQTEDSLVVQIAHNIEAVRALPAVDEEYRLL